MQRLIRRALAILLLFTATTLLADDALAPEPTIARFGFALQLLHSGDEARDKGDSATALIRFEEAIKEYDLLQRAFPDWEPAITAFRVAYCREQVRRLKPSRTLPATRAPSPVQAQRPPPAPTNAPATPPAVAHADLLLKAREQIRLDQTTAARDTLLQALRLNPDDISTRLLIATVQCQLSNYTDALYVLEMLNEERPNNVATLLALSAACVGVGQTVRAAEHVRQALKINPDSAEGHYNLARVLMVFQPPQPINAEAHYQRALELGVPADPELEAQLANVSSNAPAATPPPQPPS